MSKTNPTPEDPEIGLNLSMDDFSFFGVYKNSVVTQLERLLQQGHYLTLYMTQSTSLSNDLYMIHKLFRAWCRIEYNFRKDEYDKAQVIVYLEKRVEE